MALMKRLAYCINSKTKSIDFGDPFAEEITYKVVVKTGNTKRAGTDADVKIQLIGETGSTEPTEINKFLENDFQKGESDEYLVEMVDIGRPLLCKICEKTVCLFLFFFLLSLVIDDKGMSPDWYVDYVKVIVKDGFFINETRKY